MVIALWLIVHYLTKMLRIQIQFLHLSLPVVYHFTISLRSLEQNKLNVNGAKWTIFTISSIPFIFLE